MFRPVNPAAMLTRARAVPWAWARVNIRRRISFPTSTYQPTLKPCKVSRAPPNDKKTRSDHQPKRKLRSEFFISFCQNNRFIVSFLPQPVENIFPEAPFGIEHT